LKANFRSSISKLKFSVSLFSILRCLGFLLEEACAFLFVCDFSAFVFVRSTKFSLFLPFRVPNKYD